MKKMIFFAVFTILFSSLVMGAFWDSSYEVDMVSYYRFDETSGNVAEDIIGQNNLTIINGTFTNGGIKNNMLNVSNPTEGTIMAKSIQNMTNKALGGNKSRTINYWTYHYNPSITIVSTEYVTGWGRDAGSQAFFPGLAFNGVKVHLVYANGGPDQLLTTISPSPGLQMHTITVNSTDRSLYYYINGTLVGGGVRTTAYNTSDITQLFIGNNNAGNGNNYNGSIDELIIWNRTLSLAEIQNLYNNGTGLTFGDYFVYQFNDATYNKDVVSLSTEEFIANITFNSSTHVLSNAKFFYNGTEYNPSVIGSGDNRLISETISIPSVTNPSNFTFYWVVNITDGTTTQSFQTDTYNQSAISIGIDDCSSNPDLVLNFTMKDEEDVFFLNATGNETLIEIEAIISSILDPTQTLNFNKTYSEINPAQVCVSSGTLQNGTYRFDVQTRYTASDYVVEFYNIQNATLNNNSFPQNIDLFPLLATDSQEFLITFKDDAFLPVEDALMTITRKYVGEGIFRTVEAPLTDADGQALTHLVLGDVIYTIIVSKNGKLLAVFDNRVPFCEDVVTGNCQISLSAFSTGVEPTDFLTRHNLSYTLAFDEPTRTVSSIFAVRGGASATINLTTILYDNFGNTTVCSDVQTTSAGTLTCVIPASFGNATVRSILSKDGVFVDSALFTIEQDPSEIFGPSGAIFMLMLYLTIPLMLITTGVGIVIGAILGLILATLLNLYTGGSIIGVGSTILWFIIAGAIIIWKVNRRET